MLYKSQFLKTETNLYFENKILQKAKLKFKNQLTAWSWWECIGASWCRCLATELAKISKSTACKGKESKWVLITNK